MEELTKIQVSSSDKIFTTGAYLQAFELEINGLKQWRWVLVGQEGDAFHDGKCVDVYDFANTFEDLIQEK